MHIVYEKKEIHLFNPTLEEINGAILLKKFRRELNDFKIMINGTDKKTINEGQL